MAFIKGTTGNDFIFLDGVENHVVSTSIGNDNIMASSRNDVINMGFNSSIDYFRYGFNDQDRLDYSKFWINASLIDSRSAYVIANFELGTVQKFSTAGTLLGTDKVSSVDALQGTDGNDKLTGRNFWRFESFTGLAGVDTINGKGGEDQADYGYSNSGISVNLAKGEVVGSLSDVGTDTLREIEDIVGTKFSDTFVATGYGATSVNKNSFGEDWNYFISMGGDDVVVGNGSTGLDLNGASGSLVLDISGEVSSLAQVEVVKLFSEVSNAQGLSYVVGNILVTGVSRLTGGNYNDRLIGGGRVNTNGVSVSSSVAGDASLEVFQGRGGDDTIEGGTGFDRVTCSLSPMTEGIVVNLAAGIVVGDMVVVGSDTLRGVESVRGTHLDDYYDATGFTLSNAKNPSVNSGDIIALAPKWEVMSSNAFNEFWAVGGNDTVIGNGATGILLNYFVESLNGISSRVTFDSNQSGTIDYGLTDGGLGYLEFSGTFSVRGSNGNDVMLGSAGYQNLIGGYGDDTLRGGNGSDILFGYSGIDKNAKNFTALFTDNDFLDGGAGNDKILGDFGNDVLIGGLGIDTLEGGTGSDRFVFDAAIGSGNVDILTDFMIGVDKIILDDDVFSKLGVVGTASGISFAASKFQLGSAANDLGDRIVYNQITGKLYYDVDGSGDVVAVQIALIGTAIHPKLTAADFLVIA